METQQRRPQSAAPRRQDVPGHRESLPRARVRGAVAGQPTELRFLVDSKGPDSLSEAEQRAWRELSLAVNVGGGITPADLPGFRALVRTQAAWDAMADNFDPSGEGKITASAFASMTGRLMSQLDHFRLAPSSRGAVTIAVPERPPEPDESDPDDLRPLDELPPGRPLKQ